MDKLNHWSVEQLEYYIDVIIPIFLAELGCQNKKIYRLIKEDKESLEILFDICNKMVARTLYRNTGITGTVSRLEAAANRDM
ncbi:MAG: hypothetical protein GY940_11300 [bacterium]|nr:hypothetical protein [bacterium]